MKKRTKIILFSLLAVAAVITSYIFGTALSIISYSKIDEKCKADVAIILGAGTDGSDPSPVFKARIDHGIWLYKNGYVDKLIFTGGIGEGREESEASVAMSYAIEQGIPQSDIFIEEESHITEENIANAKIIMDENSFETAIIVSDPLHMKRAMLMANDYGIKGYSSPTPDSRYITWKTKLPFLIREEFYYIGYKVYKILPAPLKPLLY